MDNTSSYNNELVEDGTGNIKIATEVVITIAGVAATEIEGVVSLAGGITGGIDKLLGKKTYHKGVKVAVVENSATIDIDIVVEYGCRIPTIATAVQERVKEAIETMTGLVVEMVNVHINGVSFEKAEAKEIIEQ